MTTNDDDDIRRDVIRRIRTEGIEAAYRACLDVCRNSQAPAPARATAATALLRAGGLFVQSDGSGDEKAPHEMSAAEITAALKRGRRQLQNAPADDGGGEAGVFD